MFKFLKALVKRYGEDNLTARAAALAYFGVFSLGPLLFIILGVLGLLLGSEAYKEKLLKEIGTIAGPAATEAVEKLVDNQYLSDRADLALLAGGAGLVLAAIGVFGQMQRSLNDIFRVKLGSAVGWKAVIWQKIVSLSLVAIAGLILLTTVLSSLVISAADRYFDLGGFDSLWRLADFIVTAVLFTVLLALTYRRLPDVRLPWRVIFTTSLLVAVLFSIGAVILSLIISRNATISAFGAAGSVVALLLWMYYSSLIVYIGATAMSIYVGARNIKLEPRYEGEQGVVRVHQTEEPLQKPITKKLFTKFKKGLKKGLKEK